MSNFNRQRNFDLIRAILLKIESYPPNTPIQASHLTFEKYPLEVVFFHVEMLKDADFIDAIITKSHNRCGFVIKKITWKGYEFLDNAKNDTIWKKFKDEAEKKGSSMSMTIVNSLLTAAAKKYFDL